MLNIRKVTLSYFIRPSIVVALLYIMFIFANSFLHRYGALSYVHLGPRFYLHQPQAAPGYDGQFYYYIARDPLHAAQFLDKPAYRYQRILYPLLVIILSFGQVGLIPYVLLLVNFLAIVLGTEVMSRLLTRNGISPWFSLAFGLYFGQTTALIFDTTEPLTYLLVALGVLLIATRRNALAAICWGLAVLSRETAVLFPLGYMLFYLFQKRWLQASYFAFFSIAPTILWYAFISVILHSSSLSGAPLFEPVPFQGFFAFSNDPQRFWPLFFLMFIPTLLSWGLLIREAWKKRWKSVFWFIWLFNLILVTNMSRLSYVELVSAGRLSTGLVLSMLVYGWSTRNNFILWTCQIYSATFVYYALSVLA